MCPAPHNASRGFDGISRLDHWRIVGRAVHVHIVTDRGREALVRFEAVSPSIWRWTFLPPGTALPAPSPMVVAGAEAEPQLSLHADSLGLLVDGPRLRLRLNADPWCVKFLDEADQEICTENPGDVDGLGRPLVFPLGYMEQDGEIVAVTESLHLRQDEHLFGLGEKFTPLDKTRQQIVSWTCDALGSTSERSHKNIPFLWSTRGYGIFLDCTSRIRWELGTTSCQSYTMTAESPVFDGYILYGPTPGEILQHYAGLTGHAPLPPKWTFGTWISSGGTYRNRSALALLVSQLHQHNVPADVVHIDPWWMRWRKYCDFTWDRTAFPDPEGFIAWLHGRGLKLCLWEHPYISIESELFHVGKERGYFLRRPDGDVYVIDYGLSLAPLPDGIVREASPGSSWNAPVAIIDFTHPQAVAWFQDLHRPLLRMGVDVFKTDFGEDIPADAVASTGETGLTLHNIYPLLYNRAVFEVTQEERGHGLVWSRSGTSGSQRFPVCWSGDPAADFDSLACTIRGGLSAGMSGIPFWSNDIGGYRGTPSEDLYIRWAQFGLLCSHSRMHGDSPREPWSFGTRALNIVKKYIELRYQLFPYIYSTAHESTVSGIPVIRGLPLMFPDDPNVIDKDLQFLLGPWIMVAPVYDASGRRNIYLPRGTWIEYWTGRRWAGPLNIQYISPIEEIPLFVKSGAIIPMMGRAERIPEGVIDPLIMDIYPDGKSSYLLQEDGHQTRVDCQVVENNITIQWKGGPRRRVVVRINGSHRPSTSAVRLDGALLPDEQVRIDLSQRSFQISLPEGSAGEIQSLLQ